MQIKKRVSYFGWPGGSFLYCCNLHEKVFFELLPVTNEKIEEEPELNDFLP